VPVDWLAERRRHPPQDEPEDGVSSQLPHQGLEEGQREEVVVQRDWQGRRRRRSRPEVQLRTCQASIILVHGGDYRPPLGLMEGISAPSLTPANQTDATRRVAAHPARTAASSAVHGASRPSRENRDSCCCFSGSGSPVDPAGPSPSPKPRRDSGSVGLRVREPPAGRRCASRRNGPRRATDVHLVQMPVRLQPRDRLVVRPRIEI
jgi:hypothetical protein